MFLCVYLDTVYIYISTQRYLMVTASKLIFCLLIHWFTVNDMYLYRYSFLADR